MKVAGGNPQLCQPLMTALFWYGQIPFPAFLWTKAPTDGMGSQNAAIFFVYEIFPLNFKLISLCVLTGDEWG